MIYEVVVEKRTKTETKLYTYIVEIERFNEIEEQIKNIGEHKTDRILRTSKLDLSKPHRIKEKII